MAESKTDKSMNYPCDIETPRNQEEWNAILGALIKIEEEDFGIVGLLESVKTIPTGDGSIFYRLDIARIVSRQVTVHEIYDFSTVKLSVIQPANALYLPTAVFPSDGGHKRGGV